MAETTAWHSHCQFITFITFLFTVNVIRQMAPLFSKVDLNLWHDVQNEEILICAKSGKDLFNISKVIGRKKVAQFFWLTVYYENGRKCIVWKCASEMWLVRHPSRTRRFWYHIRVLFIVATCSPGMQICCHGPTYENPRWRLRPEVVKTFLRNKIFVQFQRLYLHFLWAPSPEGVCPTQIDDDHRKKTYGTCRRQITKNKMALVNRK